MHVWCLTACVCVCVRRCAYVCMCVAQTHALVGSGGGGSERENERSWLYRILDWFHKISMCPILSIIFHAFFLSLTFFKNVLSSVVFEYFNLFKMNLFTRSSPWQTMHTHTHIYIQNEQKKYIWNERKRWKGANETGRSTFRQRDKWRLPWRACKIRKLTLLQKICSYTFDFGLFLWFAQFAVDQPTDRPSQDCLVGWVFIVLRLREPDGKELLIVGPVSAEKKGLKGGGGRVRKWDRSGERRQDPASFVL